MTTYVVEEIAVSRIETGTRRREKPGALAALKASMEKVGQIHPITVRPNGSGFDLVAGERRLESAKALGWRRIWARVGDFSDEDLREIELEENVGRLDLTPAEASKARLRELERMAAELAGDTDVTTIGKGWRAGPAKTLSGGDPKKRTALKQEISRNRRHVEAAEVHPVFAGSQWKQSYVLAATEALRAIPKKDQPTAVALVTSKQVHPKTAISLLENIAEKEATARKELLALWETGEKGKMDLAMTRAARLPPMPPVVIEDLDTAIRWLEKAASRKTSRAGKYQSVAKQVDQLRQAEIDEYQALKQEESKK